MKHRSLVYTAGFIQGAVIMGYELLIPKLISPWFGSSLYVWASSLVLTMLGLATGYYISGRIKASPSKTGRTVTLTAAVIVACLVFLSENINNFLLEFPLKQGILISSFLHLFPVLVCLGMMSPLLISILHSQYSEPAGKASGKIFAFSTFAGIAGSMVNGFYLIPEKGVYFTALVMVGLLLVTSGIMHLVSTGSKQISTI